LEDVEIVSEDGGRTDIWRQRSTGRVIGRIVTRRAIYQGVYKDGAGYAPGDMVTCRGSLWHCNEATSAKPGYSDAGTKEWTLCVKQGRDGRDGKDGGPIEPAPPVALR
jgi:hypothetical protein